MPVITVQIGKKDPKIKKELIEKLTKTASEITSIPESAHIVFIEEYDRDNIGVAGEVLSERDKK